MRSVPRSIPPGTALHRDAAGYYHIQPIGMGALPPAGPMFYGAGGAGYPPAPLVPPYQSYGGPSYSPLASPYPSYGAPAPAYGVPAGHVAVPIEQLQQLIAGQSSGGAAAAVPHHSVYVMRPDGTTHDVSHSHPQLHGSNAPAPTTTIGAPAASQQPYRGWTQ